MAKLFELIAGSVPFALLFAGAAFVFCFLVLLLRRRRFSILLTACSCLYFGFLLAGTLRPESLADLLNWRAPHVPDITFQLTLGDDVSALHGLFNAALFVPWGVLGMLIGRRPLAVIPCLLSAALMTLFIETYQLFHLRSFDFGDAAANLLGCAIGVIVMLPYAIIRAARRR